MNIGPTELIIVLVIVLVIFGPKRLPSLAKSLGGGIREFKDSITNRSDDDEDAARPTGAAQAQAALGRPDEPVSPPAATASVPSEDAVPSERR